MEKNVASSGEIQGRKIEWRDKNEPWELVSTIKNLCIEVYNRHLQEGPPLGVEIPIKFEFDGHFFNLRIDELREGAIIRDSKTGRWFDNEFTIGYLPQLTMYALAVSCKAYDDRKFANIFGIKKPEELRGNPYIISPEIKTQYHHMRTSSIITTPRTDNHYYELAEVLDNLESRIADGIFPVNRHECARCIYQKVCDQTSAGMIYPKKEDLQLTMFKTKSKKRERTKQSYLRFPRKNKNN